jgi:5-dehydro-2-deoxygluconokinase
MNTKTYDIIAMGRSSIDLYSNDVGAPFEEITSFAAYVGGCPLNIGVGTQRLGLRSVLLTAVGDDKVGDSGIFWRKKASKRASRRASRASAPAP